MTLAHEEIVAFVSTTDLERAAAFYGGVLGLTVEEVTPYACVVRAGATVLRVTRVESLTVQPFTVLGWSVGDLRARLAELVARGVVVSRYDGVDQDADGVWATPGGDLVAWFTDPDGNTLSLTQRGL